MKEIIHAKIGSSAQEIFYSLEKSDFPPEEKLILDDKGNVVDIEIVEREFIPEPEPTLGKGWVLAKEKRPSVNHVVTAAGEWILKKYVPSQITNLQAKLVLKQFQLLEEVETFVNESNNDVLQMAWNHALTFDRYSHTILTMQNQLNLTDEQVDTMFIEGIKIEV